MRTFLASWCLGLLLALVASTGADAQTWSEYRSEAGRYRVLMPGAPSLSTQPVTMPDGRTVELLQAGFETPAAAFLATYVDYPADVVRGQAPDAFLKTARDGSAKGHKLRSDRGVKVGGYAAREYVILRANGIVIITRSVLVGSRLYQIIVARNEGDDKHPDTRKFLDSFTLTSR
jgi:hypothetical protein